MDATGIRPGALLAHYRVEGVLGRGGMGTVYKAHHEALDRDVAIKVVSELGGDRAAVERFLREGRAVSRMRHPNILTVFDYGEVDGQPYLVTEYIAGGSLADLLSAGPLPAAAAVGYLRDVAAAIDYAHGRQTIHRDIKPSNVLLGAGGEAILADFGLAKYLSDQGQRTESGFISGTVAYMAPEQARETAVGPPADVYSFAVMAFEILTGRLPFAGDSVLDVLIAHLQEPPPPPSTVNPELGPAVDAVVLRGLAKDPAERWPGCGQMVAALEAALRAGPVAAATVRTRPPALGRAGSGRRRLALAAGAAALLVATVLTLGTTLNPRLRPGRLGPVAASTSASPSPSAVSISTQLEQPSSPLPTRAPTGPTPLASPSTAPAAASSGAPGVVATATPRPVPTPTAAPIATPTPTPVPTVTPLHSVNISGPSSCALNTTCTMTAYVSGGSGNFSYTWSTSSSRGAGPSGSGSSLAAKYTATGNYVVSCLVKDLASGQSLTASRDLSVS